MANNNEYEGSRTGETIYARIGDIVVLPCVEVNGALGAWSLTGSKGEGQAFIEEVKDENSDIVPSQTLAHGCRFQITQRFTYDALEEYRNILDELNVEEGEEDAMDDASESQKSSAEGDDDLRKMRRDSEVKMRNEKSRNEEEFQKSVGNVLTYGSTIQLKHVSSGHFLTVLHEPEPRAKGALTVGLDAIGSEMSQFTPMAALGSKSPGERVMFGDIVTFQNRRLSEMGLHMTKPLADEGDFLHPPDFPLHPHHKRTRTVAASRQSTIFKISPWGFPRANSLPHAVHSDQPIKIIHQATDMLLTLTEDLNNVNFSLWSGETHGSHVAAMWYPEKKAIEYGGREATFGERIYLKNALTDRYLKVKEDANGEHQFLLESDYCARGITWIPEPFSRGDQPGNTITSFSRIQLKHESGLWVGLTGSRSLSESSVVLHSKSAERDSQAVCLAPEYISSMLPPLRIIRNNLLQFMHNVRTSKKKLEILISWRGFIERVMLQIRSVVNTNDDHQQSRKDALRNSGTLKAILTVMSALNEDHIISDQSHRTALGIEVHNCIQDVCDNNLENKIHVADFLGTMRKQLGGEMRAANTMAQCFEGNNTLIARATEAQISECLQIICDMGRKPRFLNLVTQLCGGENDAVLKNQNLLVELTLKPKSDGEHDILLPMRWDAEKNDLLLGAEEYSAAEMALVEDNIHKESILDWPTGPQFDLEHPEYVAFRYAVVQLQFVRAMCFGGNRLAGEILRKDASHYGLDYATLFTICSCRGMPYVLRSAALELIATLYVEPPFLTPRLPRRIRVKYPQWEQRKDELESGIFGVTIHLTDSEFRQLTDFLVFFVESLQGRLDADEKGRNALLISILEVLKLLLSASSMSEHLGGRIREHLLSLLDGRNDDNEIDAEEMNEDEQLRRFSESADTFIRSKDLVLDLLDHLNAELLDSLCRQFFKNWMEGRSNAECGFAKEVSKRIKAEQPLREEILLDGLRYERMEVAEESFHKLTNLILTREILIKKLMQSALVVNETTFHMFEQVLLSCKELISVIPRLGARDSKERNTSITQGEEAMETLKSLVTPGAQPLIMSSPISEELVRRVQRLMFSIGVHNLVLQILRKPLRVEENNQIGMAKPKDPRRRDLFNISYALLKELVPNAETREELLPHKDLFFSHFGIEKLNVSDFIAELIGSDNTSAEEHGPKAIDYFFELALSYGEKKHGRYLEAVSTIVLGNGQPVENLQAKVLFLLSDHEDDIMHLMRGESERARLEKLVIDCDHTRPREEGSELRYHLACLRTLAACTQGGRSMSATLQASSMLGYDEVSEWLLRKAPEGARADVMRRVRKVYWEFIKCIYFQSQVKSVLRKVMERDYPLFPPQKEMETTPQPTRSMIDQLICECKEAALEDHDHTTEVGGISSLEFVGTACSAMRAYFDNIFRQQVTLLAPGYDQRINLLAHTLEDLLDEQGSSPKKGPGAEVHTDAIREAYHLRNMLPDTEPLRKEDSAIQTVQERTSSKYGEEYTQLNEELESVSKSLEVDFDRMDTGFLVRDLHGAKAFVDKLTKKDKEVVPGSKPSQSWRSVVKHICRVLATSDMEHFDKDEAEGALRLLRLCLHMDALPGQPNALDDFRNDADIFNRSRTDRANLIWSQKKYIDLGVADVALNLSGAPQCQEQGLKLSTEVLEGGNIFGQKEMAKSLKRTSSLALFQSAYYELYHADRIVKRLETGPLDEDRLRQLTRLKLILRNFQLFCLGLNSPLKKLIPDELKRRVVHLLMTYMHTINPVAEEDKTSPVVGLLLQAMSFLEDLVQGPNVADRDLIIHNTDILYILSKLVSACEYSPRQSDSSNDTRMDVRRQVFMLLFAFLNGIEVPIGVLDRMTDSFDEHVLVNSMEYQNERLSKAKNINNFIVEKMEDSIENAWIFLMRLADLLEGGGANAESLPRHFGVGLSDELKKWISQRMSVVEVDIGSGVERIDFPLPKDCTKLQEDNQWLHRAGNILRDIPRGDIKEKAQHFAKQCESLKKEIDVNRILHKKSPAFIRAILPYMHIIEGATFYLGVIGFLLLILFYGEGRDEFISRGSGAPHALFGVVAILELLATTILLLLVIFREVPLYVEKNFRGSQTEHRLRRLAGSGMRRKKEPAALVDDTWRRKRHTIHSLPNLEPRPNTEGLDKGDKVERIPGLLWPKLWLHVTFFVASLLVVLGWADADGHSNGEFFLVFHLTVFLTSFEAGRVVVDAVLLAAPKLVRAFTVAVIAIAAFTSIAFTSFRENIRSEDAGTNVCGTMYKCFGQFFMNGWVNGNIQGVMIPSGVVDSVPRTLASDSKSQIRLFLFWGWSLIWGLLIINVILAILVDTFKALRDTREARERDEQENCLTCSLSRKLLDDKLGLGAFKHHVDYEHRPTSYVFFLAHLDRKPVDTRTLAEQAVDENRRSGNLWVPLQKARSIVRRQ